MRLLSDTAIIHAFNNAIKVENLDDGFTMLIGADHAGNLSERADAERRIAEAIERARADGISWSAIGAMVCTSGEAARQRYGKPVPKR